MILFTGSGSLAAEYSRLYDCRIISARTLNDDQLSTHIAEADVIVHNAALVADREISIMVDSNFNLTKRVVDLSKRVNPGVKMINISSMSFLKNDEDYLDVRSMSTYAFSKYLGEVYCIRQAEVDICNVRFSTIFYEDKTKDGLSRLGYDGLANGTVTIYNNGAALRDFIPLTIAVEYLHKLATKWTANNVLNIVSGEPLSFKHFVNLICKYKSGVKIEDISSEAHTPEVLHTFSKKHIEELGEIDFSIDGIFQNYLTTLDEDLNL